MGFRYPGHPGLVTNIGSYHALAQDVIVSSIEEDEPGTQMMDLLLGRSRNSSFPAPDMVNPVLILLKLHMARYLAVGVSPLFGK